MVGPQESAIGTPSVKFSVLKNGDAVDAVIDYGASNPLVAVAPKISANGEFALTPGSDSLTIDATITGDQFPACESFVEDPTGNKIFVGGFAPNTKEQIMRLYGGLNKPKEVWFESHIVVTVDSRGSFKQLQGGGSGSNSTGPSCENLNMSPSEWNARIMGSIPMPSDAP